jgi:tRNA-dihydrouridine synthase
MCARAFEAGWAGAAFKTICNFEIHEASPRFSVIKGDGQTFMGFKNIEQLSDHSVPENMEIFRKLKEHYPGKFILASIMGRDSEEWAYLAKECEKNGADALELNFSCPNLRDSGLGSDIGQNPELVEEYTRAVKEAVSIPVIANGDADSPERARLLLEQTGADGVMYARGALTRPSIFREHAALLRGEPAGEIPAGELRRLIRRHMELIGSLGSEDNALYRLRSIVPRYVRSLPGVRLLRQRLCACQRLEELDGILDDFLAGCASGAGDAAPVKLDKFDPPEPSCRPAGLPEEE